MHHLLRVKNERNESLFIKVIVSFLCEFKHLIVSINQKRKKLLNHANAKFIPEEIRNFLKSGFKHGFEDIILVHIELTQILTLFQEEWYRVYAKTLSNFSFESTEYLLISFFFYKRWIINMKTNVGKWKKFKN
ncbi:hypothetical protein BpHYR1_023452 [Brachionus plicatilis]|uniref:Uncharacterized protein n=1 Tax=Brachionus plicatilis TaxID=10195 RepID=A0A3M7R3W5_BRAPC|nr:hypothetical protein BpHYR1_023452 [Brachionus plicatilis]